MNVLSRAEFIELMKTKFDDINDKHPIWEPEKDLRNESSLFVVVKPLKLTYDDNSNGQKREYWNWCNNNLVSKVRCYYSDSENQVEYWGFLGNKSTLKNDALIWLLKWAT